MKTVNLPVGPADLLDAVYTVVSGTSCTIYYADDELPIVSGPTLADQQAATLAKYDAALMAHYDAVAAQRNYDSYVTVTMRAGYEGPFQAEALAFAQWMDGCNVAGYTLIQEVKAGTKPLPSVEAFITGLPVLKWS